MTLRALLSACVVSVVLLAGTAPASGAGCQAEIEKLCKGQPQLMKCLRAHESELSDECKAYLSFFERFPSCVADARRLCPSDKPSGAGIIACLRARQTDLSDDCRRELGQVR